MTAAGTIALTVAGGPADGSTAKGSDEALELMFTAVRLAESNDF